MVYTDFRPTPLQHYVYPSNGDGLYLVVDEKSTFREDNFQRAVAALTEAAQEAAAKKQQVSLLPCSPEDILWGSHVDIPCTIKKLSLAPEYHTAE